MIKVKYTADNAGFFSKSLRIVCNTEDSPIGVLIKKNTLINQIQSWQGKAIVFPDSVLYAKYTKNTLAYNVPDANYKIAIYRFIGFQIL